jgi:hypothetical protein
LFVSRVQSDGKKIVMAGDESFAYFKLDFTNSFSVVFEEKPGNYLYFILITKLELFPAASMQHYC